MDGARLIVVENLILPTIPIFLVTPTNVHGYKGD